MRGTAGCACGCAATAADILLACAALLLRGVVIVDVVLA